MPIQISNLGGSLHTKSIKSQCTHKGLTGWTHPLNNSFLRFWVSTPKFIHKFCFKVPCLFSKISFPVAGLGRLSA